jgi:replicative DNA helicase
VPEPCSPNPDANRIRSEIERLSQQQNKALEIAMHVVMSPTEQKHYDQRHQQIVDLLRQLTALDAEDFSMLPAKMVELSLQEAQRDPTLRSERGAASLVGRVPGLIA